MYQKVRDSFSFNEIRYKIILYNNPREVNINHQKLNSFQFQNWWAQKVARPSSISKHLNSYI